MDKELKTKIALLVIANVLLFTLLVLLLFNTSSLAVFILMSVIAYVHTIISQEIIDLYEQWRHSEE